MTKINLFPYQSTIPIIGFVAYSGTGKTTLFEKLIPLLAQKNIQVGLIKHAHHNFDIDQPGKDSYRLRKAGAKQTLIASQHRWALMVEVENKSEPKLIDLVHQLDSDKIDLILVEGFKHEPYAKIELNRQALNKPHLFLDDPSIIAVATDEEPTNLCDVTQLDINNSAQICQFILKLIKENVPNEK